MTETPIDTADDAWFRRQAEKVARGELDLDALPPSRTADAIRLYVENGGGHR